MVSYSLIQKYILDNLGLKYNTNQEDELYSKLSDASSSFGYDDTDDFIIWLLQQRTTKDIAEKLSSFLTIGETYFVREKKALDFLEFDFLPKLIKNRKEKNQTLRIWSVGCSSGEEPYSVAIILRRLIPNIADWQIRIDGSDINPKFLNKAIKGEYSSWSFRGTSDHFKELNFIRTSVKTFQIKKEIRDMVTFSYVNIADELFYLDPTNFSKYDVILCRNVLIYFSKPGIERVSKRFYQSLNTDGVFIVSPVEASNLISKNFSRETYEGVTIYRNSPEKIITDSKPANKSNK